MQLDRPFLTVTSTVDGDVLAALANVDSSLSVTQLRQVMGRYSGEGVRKSLARLVEQGIVHAIRVGNGVTYALNRDHLASEAIVGLANLRSELFRRMTAQLETWPSLRYAAVFGSAAGGVMRAGSDIDLVAVHDDGVSELDLDERQLDLTLLVWRSTGNSLSPVRMSVSALREHRDEAFLADVQHHGVVLAGSRSWFDEELRAGASRARS